MSTRFTQSVLWVVFYLIFALNFCQSYYTELLPDEAYYWIYNQNLDWGYFDHPPMIALFIEVSSWFFQDELGVRFFSGISLIVTAYLVWKTLITKGKPNVYLFIALFFSMALINAYGFIATPDAALILFTALLLYTYNLYLQKTSLFAYFLLAIAAAGMLYSKYQGLWVIVCILASNPSLLRDKKLWLTGLFTLVLFSPHLIWQFDNDFPSIRYHLFERVSNRTYKFEQTLMHFVNMIAIVGITFPLVYKAFFKQIRTKDKFSRGLVFIVFGFFGLFFFSSFRGRVQAQWLVPISFSLIILSYQYFNQTHRAKKWLYGLALANFCVLLVVRVFFAFPSLSPIVLDTHNNKQWTQTLQENFPDIPKFFVNSYQNTAAYWFYTDEIPYYYQNFTGRKNHFTLMQQHKYFELDTVLIINRGRTSPDEIAFKGVGKDSIYLKKVANFSKPSQLYFDWSEPETIALKGQNQIIGVLRNRGEKQVNVADLVFKIGFRHPKKRSVFFPTKLNLEGSSLDPGASKKVLMSFDIPNSTELEGYNAVGVGATATPKVEVFKISDFRMFTFTP